MSTTNIDFLYLSEPEMIEAGVTDIARCVDVMEEALVLMRRGDYRMAGLTGNSHGAMISFPAETDIPGMPLDGPDRRFMAMPAYLGGRFRATGVKWYGSNAENRKDDLPRSIHVFVLNDTDSGAPKAIMSANLLSAYRTGAVPGVGVKHFAKPDATTLAVIGPGVMGRTVTEATLAQRPGITTIKVKGRSQAGVDRYAAFIQEKYPQVTSVVKAESIEEAVRDADIVISAPTTDASGSAGFPYYKEEWLKPGAVMLLPAAARFDDDFLINRARTVLDARGLYDAWAEEYGTEAYQQIGIPGSHWMDLVLQGKMPESKLEEIADVATGDIPTRNSDDEIILYSVGGMPIEDVAWAADVYDRAVELGIGTTLNLRESPALR